FRQAAALAHTIGEGGTCDRRADIPVRSILRNFAGCDLATTACFRRVPLSLGRGVGVRGNFFRFANDPLSSWWPPARAGEGRGERPFTLRLMRERVGNLQLSTFKPSTCNRYYYP